MRRRWLSTARRAMAVALLVLAIAGTLSVIVSLAELERIAAADRPEARHWLEREPVSWSWSRFAAAVATSLYVHTQRSVVVAPASAFAIAAAWSLLASARRARDA
jgi:hypothetical protein